MKKVKDEIEGPVKNSPWLFVGGILVLVVFFALGILLIVESLKEPEGPWDQLDTKKMLASAAGLISISAALIYFLIRIRNTNKKRSGKTRVAKKTTSTKKRKVSNKK
jgi:divalent metal cation (Fe/Co/Zn/Cd) transporter